MTDKVLGMTQKLNEHLADFEKYRSKREINFDGDRVKYAGEVAKWFLPCAKWILAGHFRVKNNEGDEDSVRLIYPTAIELYYHEEGPGRFKDPIMYHTDDRKRAEHSDYFNKRGISSIPYYPFGSLNPHTSGIDITFENPKEQYRASFLIREYVVDYGKGRELSVKNSTDIYDDMLINGICLGNADWIEWCDGKALNEDEIIRQWRRNVPDYKPKDGKPGEWEKNPDGENTFASAGGRFAKCPFNWQFRKK